MKKQILALFAISGLLFSCSNKNGNPTSIITGDTSSTTSEEELGPIQKTYKTRRESSIFADTCFRNGFRLISPESTNQYTEKVIDYNGERETDFYNDKSETKTYWDMCQWWTPYNFKDASYEKVGDVHTYQNESRFLGVNTKTGELQMKLDADAEYRELYEDGVKPAEKSWSHFLIQTSTPQDIAIYPSALDNSGEGLYVNFDIRIDELSYKRSGTPVGSDCAQLMFYLLIRNDVPADSDPNEVGKRNVKMWFGLPLFDSRYGFIDEYRAGDTGFEGATGHLICNISNREFLDEPMQVGEQYNVNIDVLDHMKQAFVFGVQNHYLENCQWQNMKLDYMNFGWEIPGNYAVDSTIENLDVYVE